MEIDVTKFIVLGLYVAVLFLIGVFASRRVKSMSDFYVGGKRLGYWAVAFSARATGESGWLLIGLTGMGALSGLSAYWVVVGEVLGVAISWWFMAKKFKRHLGVPLGERAGHGEKTGVAADGDDIGVGDDERQVPCRRAFQQLAHGVQGCVHGALGALLVGGPRAVDGFGAVREEKVCFVGVGDRLEIEPVQRDGTARGPCEVQALLTE